MRGGSAVVAGFIKNQREIVVHLSRLRIDRFSGREVFLRDIPMSYSIVFDALIEVPSALDLVMASVGGLLSTYRLRPTPSSRMQHMQQVQWASA